MMKRVTWKRMRVFEHCCLTQQAKQQFLHPVTGSAPIHFNSHGNLPLPLASSDVRRSNTHGQSQDQGLKYQRRYHTSQIVRSHSSDPSNKYQDGVKTHQVMPNSYGSSADGCRYENKGHEEKERADAWLVKAVGVAGGICLALFIGYEKQNLICAASAPPMSPSSVQPQIQKAKVTKKLLDTHLNNLPTYKKSEVAKHDDPQKRLWVTYKRGVFDVTDFLHQHPGGDKLLMAAGGSLEGFWDLFPVHKKDHVLEILSQYRIGNLHEEDVEQKGTSQSGSVSATKPTDAFVNEPPRNPVIIARTLKPFNGETPPHLLTNNFYTPNDLFYIRNHLPVPHIDLDEYELEIEGLELRKGGTTLRLEEIKKLPKKEISATIQCGGNRRSNMNEWKEVHGLAWSGGAIGNAKWAGASLLDVLKLSGFCLDKYEHPQKIHIQFEGLDSDPSGESYGASIPLSYLLDANFQPIIAYEMNGESLPLDHGFPLRIILPGIVGARSVKWLGRIVISDEENKSPWQQRDYKVFSPSVTLDTVDYSSSPSIMDTPVTSYICSHGEGTGVSVDKGKSTDFRGYAFSGGGRDIIRVEVSLDRGNTWALATTVTDKNQQRGTRNWSWVLWEASVAFAEKGEHELWVKAVDSGYNQQPENFSGIWNYRGLVSNAYHKIKVKVQ